LVTWTDHYQVSSSGVLTAGLSLPGDFGTHSRVSLGWLLVDHYYGVSSIGALTAGLSLPGDTIDGLHRPLRVSSRCHTGWHTGCFDGRMINLGGSWRGKPGVSTSSRERREWKSAQPLPATDAKAMSTSLVTFSVRLRSGGTSCPSRTGAPDDAAPRLFTDPDPAMGDVTGPTPPLGDAEDMVHYNVSTPKKPPPKLGLSPARLFPNHSCSSKTPPPRARPLLRVCVSGIYPR
jgi:hypothetical protein